MAHDAPVIETSGLTKRFGGLTAVDSVDLEVHPNEIALVEGLSAQAVVLPLVLSVGLVAAGVAAFVRRDLR